MIDYTAVGKRIRKKRKSLEFTQEYVSEKIDVSANFYSHIENATRKAGMNTFVKISSVLDISLDYMMFGKKVIPPSLSQQEPTTKTIINEVLSMDENEKQLLVDIIKSFEHYKEKINKELR